MANFKGFSSKFLTSADLFSCKQQQREPLKEYYHRLLHLRARAPNITDEVVIETAIRGLRIGAFASHLAREKPATLEGLYEEFEKYCKSDSDLRRRLEEQAQNKQIQGNNINGRDRRNQGQHQQRRSDQP